MIFRLGLLLGLVVVCPRFSVFYVGIFSYPAFFFGNNDDVQFKYMRIGF